MASSTTGMHQSRCRCSRCPTNLIWPGLQASPHVPLADKVEIGERVLERQPTECVLRVKGHVDAEAVADGEAKRVDEQTALTGVGAPARPPANGGCRGHISYLPELLCYLKKSIF